MLIVKVKNLKKYYSVRRPYLTASPVMIKAVDGVTLEIAKGETFGLVGESGCGKTTLGKLILGIIKADSGSVEVASRKVQVIFQDPQNSLDPRMIVGDLLSEGLLLNREKGDYKKRIEEALYLARLPRNSVGKYPHEFSQGERQRIAIARAVITNPEFIVCDEPVSSLDVTVQMQILNLLKNIQKKLSITYLFISHDLRVIKYMCGRVAVMKDGRIVEEGPVDSIYRKPRQDYTKMLIGSIPEIRL